MPETSELLFGVPAENISTTECKLTFDPERLRVVVRDMHDISDYHALIPHQHHRPTHQLVLPITETEGNDNKICRDWKLDWMLEQIGGTAYACFTHAWFEGRQNVVRYIVLVREQHDNRLSLPRLMPARILRVVLPPDMSELRFRSLTRNMLSWYTLVVQRLGLQSA